MTCRCAPALVALRTEFDHRWPRRDRASDGCCGDARHAATKSDHNPDGAGWAHALDIDEDFEPGHGDRPLEWLWNRWVAAPDPRIKYLIYERRIFYASTRDIEAYDGLNAHDHHMHVSIKPGATFDVSPWLMWLDDTVTAAEPPAPIHAEHSGDDVIAYSHMDNPAGPLDLAFLLLRPSGAMWGISEDGHGLYAWGTADPNYTTPQAGWRGAFHDRLDAKVTALAPRPSKPGIPDPGPYGVVIVRDDGAEYALVQNSPAGGGALAPADLQAKLDKVTQGVARITDALHDVVAALG